MNVAPGVYWKDFMRLFRPVIIALFAVTATTTAASAEVQLMIGDGRVSLVAKDATVRQILAEWARVGQTRITNLERIAGGPVTLELINVSEEHALEVLLRSVGGYILAPRPIAMRNLSRFDRLIVMSPSVAPRAATAVPVQAPVFQQPPFPGVGSAPTAGGSDEDSDNPGPLPAVPVPANRGPVFAFPPPQVISPQIVPPPGTIGGAPAQMAPPLGALPSPVPTPGPSTSPSAPTAPFGGVARPGMVVPAPPGTSLPSRSSGSEGQ
jgi:hypothetical protein